MAILKMPREQLPYFSESSNDLSVGDKLVVGVSALSFPAAFMLGNFVFQNLKLTGSAVVIALTIGLLWLVLVSVWILARRPDDPEAGPVLLFVALSCWGLGFVVVMCLANWTATVPDAFQSKYKATHSQSRACMGTRIGATDPLSHQTFNVCVSSNDPSLQAPLFEGQVLRGPLGARLVSWRLVRPEAAQIP